MRMRGAVVLVLVSLASPSVAGDATGAFGPYEDVLQVVAELTWHARDDVYRLPPPKDPTGHDVFHLALDRLENWEKRYPGRLRDVTTYGRAEALEHLGEYDSAATLYGRVAAMTSPIAARARDGQIRAAAFAEAAALPEDGPDLDAQLAALRKKLDAWGKLVERTTDSAWQPIALVEEERLERRTTDLVVQHRRQLEKGDATAERALRFMIEKHADSKNLPEHILRLGDLYADIARDYVEAHDRPRAFVEDEFIGRADRALDTYRKVATWDGAPEKPEGQARFAGFDAYKTQVLARYR